MVKRKRVVVIGGGTGTYAVLSGLRKYPELDLSVIVSMTDSGGSNRVIRDEFGLLPTSDIRQCIVALASNNSHKVLRELFSYRYTQGTGISGMTFGNLFMAALTDILKSQKEAIEETCKILDVEGKVIPVTFDNCELVATYDNNVQVLGEHFIDEPSKRTIYHRITLLEVFPRARVNKDALEAIKNADLIVLGPGDLYTSILCNVVVQGIAKAIKDSKAKKLFVMNIMTRFGQTDNFTARDHVDEIEKYLGENTLNYVLVNKKGALSSKALAWYRKHDAVPVKDDLNQVGNLKVVRKNFSSSHEYEKSKSDKLQRSLIRHDSNKLAKVVVELLNLRS